MTKEPPKTSPKKKVTYIYDIKNNPVFRRLFQPDIIKPEDIKLEFKKDK